MTPIEDGTRIKSLSDSSILQVQHALGLEQDPGAAGTIYRLATTARPLVLVKRVMAALLTNFTANFATYQHDQHSRSPSPGIDT